MYKNKIRRQLVQASIGSVRFACQNNNNTQTLAHKKHFCESFMDLATSFPLTALAAAA